MFFYRLLFVNNKIMRSDSNRIMKQNIPLHFYFTVLISVTDVLRNVYNKNIFHKRRVYAAFNAVLK